MAIMRPNAWRALNSKIVTVTKGWWDAYSLFLEGEADMVMSYSTSPAYHQIAENVDQYAAAAFSEGHYMQIEVAAMLKNAPQPELAKQFMAFIQGPEFQGIIPTTNWMYPTQTSAIPDGFERFDHTRQCLPLFRRGCERQQASLG